MENAFLVMLSILPVPLNFVVGIAFLTMLGIFSIPMGLVLL